jgi:hypothetical protein
MRAVPQPDARDPRGGSAPVDKPPLPRTVLAVAAMTLLEAALLVVLALVLVIETIIKDPRSLVGSLGGAALALAAAAVLAVLVPHLRRCKRFARTPVVVLQILWLPVGFSLTFQSGLPEYGIPVLICALVTLGLFATPSARAALTEPVGQ